MPITQEQFLEQRQAVRGTGNAEPMHVPLWDELILSGENAWAVAERYGRKDFDSPGWCFDRFGMSRTRLPDGRIICIAGEHEDFYDPDFFLYNDVIVIHPDGRFEIFGYSPKIFPPTDFHSSTLIGNAIYIIGRMGYQGQRGGTSTPICRLNISSMSISPVVATGTSPGWISGHRSELAPDGKTIHISGGEVLVQDDAGKEKFQKNHQHYALDTDVAQWSLIDCMVSEVTTPSRNLIIPGWAAMETEQKAQDVCDAIVRAVAPNHPLFCGDFTVIARWRDWEQNVALKMLDGTGRWAICDGPGYTGRDAPPLAVTFYPDFDRLIEAAAKLDATDRSPKSS